MNKSPITFNRLNYLDNLRFLGILMVVAIHSLGYCIPFSLSTHNFISPIVSTIAVPIFFMVDGFLFFNKYFSNKKFMFIDYIKKSFCRLLIPWLIFSILYAVSRFIFEKNGFLQNHIIIDKSFFEILSGMYKSLYAPQMYFLLSLFFIRLISPLFIVVIKNSNTYVLLLICIIYSVGFYYGESLYYSFIFDGQGLDPFLHAFWGVKFYLVGFILSKLSVNVDLKKIAFPVLLIFVLFIYFDSKNIIFINKYIIQVLYLISVFLLFNFINNKIYYITSLGENSMGIYLIHAPVVLKLTSIIVNKLITTPIYSFLFILLIVLNVSYFITYFIKKIPSGSILFGEIKT